jgi:hypothetical protein
VSKLVGRSGLEPPTSRLSGGCSNQLSYRPSSEYLQHQAGSSSRVLADSSVPPFSPTIPCQNTLREENEVNSRPRDDAPIVFAAPVNRVQRRISLRKEVIQPQVPLRLPCYDLVPITGLTVGAALLAVRQATSGTTSFRGLTGGVYKAQEHIHRGMADPRLLAIPTSWRRIGLVSRLGDPLYRPL